MNAQEPMERPEAETEDARPLLVGAIAAALALIVGFGICGGLLIVRRTDIDAQKSIRGPDESFQRGVQVASDVDRSWAEINRSLVPNSAGYAWIDRRAGIVRVPISRAIDLICAEQGKPNGERRGLP